MKSARNLLMTDSLWRIAIISLLLATCYLLLAVFSPAHAFEAPSAAEIETSSQTTSNTLNTKPGVEANLHNMSQIFLIETMSAIVCQIAGFDPTSTTRKCLGVDSKTGEIGFTENGGGAIAVVGSLIDATLTPPATTSQYLAYLGNNFGVAKSAYAQENPCARGPDSARGIGFCSLTPVLELWIAMRNIVYLILILVFVITGLGIMLRIHIDPRTVMTLQNQIPKIIVGIVAITFSFAIAGLLIDLMWVTTYLFAGVITSATSNTPGVNMNMMGVVTAGNPFEAINYAYPGGVIDMASGASRAFADLINDALNGLDMGIIEDAVAGVVHVLGFLIIFIAILVALIRLWIALVITYISVILDVIFAPFWILGGLLPGAGENVGIGAWFRDLIANLAVFPVAISFFLLGSYFVQAFGTSLNSQSEQLSFPLLGGTNPAVIGGLIGLGFTFMLPNLLATMKAALKAPKTNFGPIMGPVKVGPKIVGGVTRGGINEYARKASHANEGQGTLLTNILYSTGIARRTH